MRIALAQINPIVGDLPGNHQKIHEYTLRAQKEHADIVIFPELALCGYPPEDLLFKEHFVKDNIKRVKQLASQTRGISAVIGFVDMKGKDIYNAAVLISDGKIKNVYHKRDLPNYGVFDEKRYFKSGKSSSVQSVGGVKVGISICEDIWISDGVCEEQKRRGAKLLINISSSPYDMGKLKEREKVLINKARKLKCYICYVNVVGGQDELVFDGSSLVIDPRGKIIARAAEFEEDLLVIDLPLGKKTAQKEKAQVLRKPGSTIERVHKALVLGTHDYIRKNGFQKVLIGLSGGIDSALVAAIAVEAIGKENVVGVTMPSRYSSTGTLADAKKIAQNLGIKFLEIPIEGIVKGYTVALKDAFANVKPNIAEENIQARIRGNLLMALSNKFGWLVLTTGNKSEIAVGYCTLYGDMSGGLAVIKDVPKTIVYQLSHYINKRSGNVIPKSIITRAPTAELRANQKDQDTLPEYDKLDRILTEYIEEHRSFPQLTKHYAAEMVKSVIQMVDRNEYKRRQASPGIKITPRAFGRDRRLPITNKYKEF